MKAKIKNFFRIERAYRFEWNDLRAVLSLINFVLLLFSFPVGAAFGLSIAILGLVKDLTVDRHIGILSAALSQHHLLGFEIAQLQFHHLC